MNSMENKTMYPKIEINFEYLLSTKRGKNVLGEYLRTLFFNSAKGMGCYETFELNPWITVLPDDVAEIQVAETGDEKVDIVKEVSTCASYQGIVMRYRWDGDGELEFSIPYKDSFKTIYNFDCKCDHGWQGLTDEFDEDYEEGQSQEKKMGCTDDD